jgi:hypothetical protein
MLLGPFRTSLCVGSKTLRHRHHNGRNGVTRIQMSALVRGLPSTRPDEPPSDTCIKVYGKTRLPLLKISYYLSPAWLRTDLRFAPLQGNRRFEQLVRDTV